jgi:Flp pilus assembly protein TadD
MAVGLRICTIACAARVSGIVTLLTASTLLTACAELGAAKSPPPSISAITTGSNPQSELEKATDYWGKEYAKNPRHAQIALNYGRLALQFDQLSVAQKLLEQANDPTNPDWRVISARGTVFAKQGKYSDAVVFYERALALAPNQASILSNLGLAELMSGHADRAEELLRMASYSEGVDPKVQQNLALVLGLEGKYDEAKTVVAQSLPPESAAQNVAFLRQMVKNETRQSATTATGQTAGVQYVPASRTSGTETSGIATAWLTRTSRDVDANSPPAQH